MKLYFAPGLCSLSPHIVLREADMAFALEQVSYLEKKTSSGADYWAVNPKGQVPVLELPSGERLTECAVILQYIADRKPSAGLIPACGTAERYRVQEWLNFIASELHKSFVPIFRPSTPDEYKRISKEGLGKRFNWLDRHLAERHYLMGEAFLVADAYLFTVLRWCSRIDIDISGWTNLKTYADHIAARPKVQEAMKVEGLI
jgi:glutathione S-transferase